jgi:hypothetical protein
MINYINQSERITEGVRKSFKRNHHEAIISADDFENVQQLKNDCNRQNQILKLAMR